MLGKWIGELDLVEFLTGESTLLALTTTTSLLYDAALALVYPQACAVCGASVESRSDGVVCAGCWQEARVFSPAETKCWKCGTPSPVVVDTEKRELVRCWRCEEAGFTAARACGLYEGALRASIISLKREPHVATRLVRLLLAAQQQEPINSADLIIPVPLHPERERERGFNQAVLLARELSRRSHLPLDEHSLVRRLHTSLHRAGMDARARRESVSDAFAVCTSRLVTGRRVLLVDDVFTTGATASACAVELKEAGAEEVFVLTIARV